MGFLPDIGKAIGNVTGTIGAAVNDATKAVSDAGQRAVHDVTHPADLVNDAVAAVKAVPGAVVNGGALAVAHGVAQIGGRVASGIGDATGWKDLSQAGRAVVATDSAILQASFGNPIAAGEVIAGAAGTAFGLPGAQGLLLKGGLQIA